MMFLEQNVWKQKMDFLKCEIPVFGYIESIFSRRQIWHDEKYLFTDILQIMLGEKNETVCVWLLVLLL